MKKTIFTPAFALLGTSLLLGAANAQMSDNSMNNGAIPTGMMEKSMMTSDADKQFLMDTAQGSVYDQATAELATQKAQSKSVQSYALRLMDDHNRLNKMLLMQANKRGLVLPLTMSDDDNTKLSNLMGNNAGAEFDMAYLQEAIRINADDVRKGNEAINASSDQQFRSLMRDYVKTEQSHLDSASEILAGLQKNFPAMKGVMMNNGAMTNGAMMNNGAMTNGSMTNGSMTNGSMTNGSMTNGSMTNGSMTNGSMTADAMTAGATNDDTMTDDAMNDGAANGATNNSATANGAKKKGKKGKNGKKGKKKAGMDNGAATE